ncbi:MAG TPA: hypothetical protein VEW74_03570 [Candidatus Nitrosotalea sp.]|nr:hypothetical protein [Candidatus Nitrosotalea sp.]
MMRSIVTASIFAMALAPAAAQTTLTAPAALAQQLDALKPVERFASLPAAIRVGQFTVNGTAATGWEMAEPGAAFSATDVPVPGAPGRRLIFAGCTSNLCVIHYERGGIAHFYEILVLSLRSKSWTAIWNLVGAKAIANLDVFRVMVRRSTLGRTWRAQPVRGDF